ncbi:MAG TPA: aldehyde dehydrogenase family protein [Acidimicrobiales bacterium]|nr:aldehyde dehydrogenase family protein [Acidimicrobiales bacterium]
MNTAERTRPDIRLVIGGELVVGAEGSYPVLNPAHPDDIALEAPAASPAQVDRAMAAARNAQPGWDSLGFAGRLECLRTACSRAQEAIDLDAAAALLTQEHGKVRVEALFDLATTGGMLEALAPLMAEALEPRQAGPSTVHPVAHGVVGAVLPFNWPAAVMGNKILPALLAGNTAVVKTPPTCPGAVLELAAAIATGLPAGVLNTLNGPTAAFGARVVAHAGLDMVSFTGGVAAGRSVLSACAPHLRPVVLELGGNDPAIIGPDLEPSGEVADRLLEAAFATSGQVCMAIKRLYLPADRLEGWRDALVESLSSTVVGDGMDEGVTMGPVHTEAARDRVEGMIADAAAGATEIVRPAAVTQPGAGWTVSPALVVAPDPDTALVREEQFAPALPLLPYRQVDEAVSAANDTAFGLCASVWTGDADLAERVAVRLRAGTVWTNAHGMAAMDHLAPMGGWGESGLGVEMGVEGMAAFTRPRVHRRGSL